MTKLVLIIDDDQNQRRLLERMLEASGYRVRSAVDGEAGLAAARSSPPDLVLLDVMMPNLNGYQTCRRFKADPELGRIPIIILTTKDQPSDEFWASEVGADRFLHKPVDIPTLLATIKTLVEPA